MENSKPLIFLSAADERVAPLTSKNRQRDNADGSPAPKDSKSGVNLEGYVRSPARGLGVANGRPHISRIERSRRSMHAARGVSDEMLDGQVRLGGTFRHIWALEISQFRLTAITKTYPNIATIAPLCILVPFAMGRVVCHICRAVEPLWRSPEMTQLCSTKRTHRAD